jgi:glycerol-3-phosphate dehydrogenase (NAD(P)+)
MPGMSRVAVIGGGAFGTAMACVLSRSGHDALIWALEPEVVEAINSHSTNPVFLRDVPLPPAVRATNDLKAAARGGEFMLMAVPAQHLRGVATQIRDSVPPGMPIVTCSKGIERGSCALMPEVISQTLPSARVAVLSGPSFAREIALDLPCGVALACEHADIRDFLARAIENPRFCVHPSRDVIGTAIGGVMKNVIAIASGIVAGRKLGENARATLITYGLDEAARLGVAKGARPATFMGLAGIGDLMLTANSLQSRNTSLGVALGEGRKLADILAGRKEVTEGVSSVEALAALAGRLGVDMPITETLDDVLNRGAGLDAAMAGLLARLADDGRQPRIAPGPLRRPGFLRPQGGRS